jgi:hypothetical protein
MTTRCVWTCSVEWDRAREILLLGCGRRVPTWDERVWRYWRELGWDGRPSAELDTQPPEVQAYSLNPLEVLLLGVRPDEPTTGVLFVLPEVRWAAVATETRIERVDEEDE